MERNNFSRSEQQKEIDRQLNVMATFGSMGLGLQNPTTDIGNQDIETDIEHLSE